MGTQRCQNMLYTALTWLNDPAPNLAFYFVHECKRLHTAYACGKLDLGKPCAAEHMVEVSSLRAFKWRLISHHRDTVVLEEGPCQRLDWAWFMSSAPQQMEGWGEERRHPRLAIRSLITSLFPTNLAPSRKRLEEEKKWTNERRVWAHRIFEICQEFFGCHVKMADKCYSKNDGTAYKLAYIRYSTEPLKRNVWIHTRYKLYYISFHWLLPLWVQQNATFCHNSYLFKQLLASWHASMRKGG